MVAKPIRVTSSARIKGNYLSLKEHSVRVSVLSSVRSRKP
jgi:hypothetical protein